MFEYVPDSFNYAACFGAVLGFYLLVNVETVARVAVTFVKGVLQR